MKEKSMASRTYKEFTASEKSAPGPACKRIGDIAANEHFEVSIYLKPRGPEPKAAPGVDVRAALAAHRQAQHAHDFKLIEEFAHEHGLSVAAKEPARRLIRLGGTAAQFQAAFQTNLAQYQEGQKTFRGRSGALKLPIELHAIVESILGVDSRTAAQPRLVFRPAAATSDSHLPNSVSR
jgi:kumamolisin